MYKEAPWKLKGDGYILLYKFKKHFIKNHIYSQDFLKDCPCGGLKYYKPIAVIKVTDFNIVFPKAEIEGMKL